MFDLNKYPLTKGLLKPNHLIALADGYSVQEVAFRICEKILSNIDCLVKTDRGVWADKQTGCVFEIYNGKVIQPDAFNKLEDDLLFQVLLRSERARCEAKSNNKLKELEEMYK